MSSALDSSMYLRRNPQLPRHPLGAYTDSMYEASRAQLEQEVQQRYADILQQLGYVDPQTGRFIKGLVEIGADRQRSDLGTQLGLARQGVDQQSQRDQNLFSGYRGTQIAQAEHPFVTALANLDVDVPQQLHTLWEHAGDLLNEYNVRNNLLLAEAAGRFVPPEGGDHGQDYQQGDSTDRGAAYGGDVAGRIVGSGRLGTTGPLHGAVGAIRGAGSGMVNPPSVPPVTGYEDILRHITARNRRLSTLGGI